MPGKKISRANMQRIQAIADHAIAMGAKHPGMQDYTPIGKADMSFADRSEALRTAVQMATSNLDGYPYIEDMFDSYVIIEIGDTCYRADYSMAADGSVTLAARDAWVEVEEVWTPVQTSAAKAGLVLDDTSSSHYATMKAVGDRQLEVKVAYGGHKNGRDSHGEYFSPNTDFDPENFPAPPLLYYHGYTEQNKKAARPVVTGKFISRRSGSDGHYLTYQLKTGRYADLQWDAAQKGACVVSPGTVGHLIRKDNTSGELLYWPLAEVSAWDYDSNRPPANLHSVAMPALKAAYLEAGIPLPTILVTAPPEAGGDPASADIPDDEAGRILVAEISKALLHTRKA